jgi:4-carboxymuconolactone decarboxylase
VRAVAPALEKYEQDILFGDLWKRGLTVRDRSIVTLAALVTRNQTAEMPYYLNLALDNGVKPSEISEIITHLAFYAGWGNAMAATTVAKDAFAARKITADQLPPVSPNLLALNEVAEADSQRPGGVRAGCPTNGPREYRHEQRADPGRDRGGAHASRLLCWMAQRILRHAGGQGRI